MFPIIGFSQNNNTNVQIETGNKSVYERSADVRDRKGEYYLGNGVYEIVRVQGGSLNSGKEKNLLEEAANKAEDLKVQYGASSYKIISKDFSKMVFLQQPGFLELKIQLLDVNGNPLLKSDEGKEDAKKKLLELKKLKEDDIITEEEYNKAAAPYKKILLGL